MEKFNITIAISPRNNYFLEWNNDDDFIMCVVRNNKLYLIQDNDDSVNEEITLEKFVEMIKERKGITTIQEVIEKHDKINKLFEEGKDIDPELTKNFITFPLKD